MAAANARRWSSRRHRRGHVPVDDRPRQVQPVAALHGAVRPLFALDLRRLLLHRSGSGSPAVVFLPGGGAVGLDYLNVQERAAQLTTSVIYDRAGTGSSNRVELPRSSAEVADELRELLRPQACRSLSAGRPFPGRLLRPPLRAPFPAEVAGLVLLDPAHEDYHAYMPRELLEIWQAWDPGQALPDELPQEPASSTALGTSPSTSAVPTPSPRRSRTCSPRSAARCEGLASEDSALQAPEIGTGHGAAGRNDTLSAVTLAEFLPLARVSLPVHERPVMAIYQHIRHPRIAARHADRR